MTNTVTRLKADPVSKVSLDVRDAQDDLLAAEKACLHALRTASKANMSFVSVLEETGSSVVNPAVLSLLQHAKNILVRSFDNTREISLSHAKVQKYLTSLDQFDVQMTGGIPKPTEPEIMEM